MKNDATRCALARFANECAREADRAERLGQRRYAAGMRATALRYFAGAKALSPPKVVDLETARRRERGRAHAAVVLTGLH